MTRTRLLWISLGLLLLAGSIATVMISRVRDAGIRRQVAAGVPARPDLSGWPEQLRIEIDAAEAAIFDGGDAREGLVKLSTLYHANGNYAEALHTYEHLRELEPREPRWWHRAAHIHAAFGEHDRAVPLWREALRLAPDYLPARVGFGEALLKSAQFDEAAEAFRAVQAKEPDNVYAALGLARIDINRGDWMAARQKLERIASQTQGLLGADLLATAYEQTGEPRRGAALRAQQKSHGMYVAIADPWIDELMSACFDSYRLALESGAAGLRTDLPRAQQLLNQAMRLSPEDAYLHFQAGTLAEQQNNLNEARQHLERAIRLDEKLTDAWTALARVYEATGNTQAAWRALSEGLTANPDSPALLIERGRRYKAQGRTDAAMADFRRVTRLRRDEALAFIQLATILLSQNQVDEGIRVLEAGLEAEPSHPIALSIITFVSIHQGLRSEADRWWQEVLYQPRVPNQERLKLQRAYQEKFGELPPTPQP